MVRSSKTRLAHSERQARKAAATHCLATIHGEHVAGLMANLPGDALGERLFGMVLIPEVLVIMRHADNTYSRFRGLPGVTPARKKGGDDFLAVKRLMPTARKCLPDKACACRRSYVILQTYQLP